MSDRLKKFSDASRYKAVCVPTDRLLVNLVIITASSLSQCKQTVRNKC